MPQVLSVELTLYRTRDIPLKHKHVNSNNASQLHMWYLNLNARFNTLANIWHFHRLSTWLFFFLTATSPSLTMSICLFSVSAVVKTGFICVFRQARKELHWQCLGNDRLVLRYLCPINSPLLSIIYDRSCMRVSVCVCTRSSCPTVSVSICLATFAPP